MTSQLVVGSWWCNNFQPKVFTFRATCNFQYSLATLSLVKPRVLDRRNLYANLERVELRSHSAYVQWSFLGWVHKKTLRMESRLSTSWSLRISYCCLYMKLEINKISIEMQIKLDSAFKRMLEYQAYCVNFVKLPLPRHLMKSSFNLSMLLMRPLQEKLQLRMCIMF